jgi:hypothetical protein
MIGSQLNEIHACADLIGFWQFSVGGREHFGVLERDPDATHSTLTIGRIAGDRSEIVRRVSNPDVSIRGIDARTVGDDLIFLLEFNRVRALQVERATVATLLDASSTRNPLQVVRDLELPDAQRGKVRLPPPKMWHAADLPKPIGWLFSARLVRGVSAPEAIANTADGQAVVVGADQPADRPMIAEAAEPQELRRDGHRYLGFKRYEIPYYPYWELPHYSGDDEPRIGDLTAVVDAGRPQSLSTELGIGPVVGFGMADDPGGTPMMFALRQSPSATRVAALALRNGSWAKVDDWEIDAGARGVSAERASDGWHLVFAIRTPNGWSLRHQRWSTAR